MQDDPVRLKDDPDVDPALRDDLARAAELTPAIDAVAGLARLRAGIEGAGGGGLGGAGPWIAGAALIVALGGGAILWALGPSHEGRPPAPAPVAATAPSEPMVEPAPIAAAVEPEAAPIELATEVPAPAPSPRSTRRARAVASVPVRSTAEPEPAGDPLREEMALLARTREALPSDPTRSLALAEEGQRRFPSGIFAEERDAIAILALSAIGRADEARRRGERFLRAHPSGTFTERVRRAIAPR